MLRGGVPVFSADGEVFGCIFVNKDCNPVLADQLDRERRSCELLPDVVIMDVGLPGLKGIQATRQITDQATGSKVIALSMHSDKRYVAASHAAGASAYLLKSDAFEELVVAIREVAADGFYLSAQLTEAAPENLRRAVGNRPDMKG